MFEDFSDVQSMFIGEIGQVTDLNHVSQTIVLENSYANPVIFAQPLSRNGSDPAIVRIEDIEKDRFTARIQEPNHKDGWHTTESFSYLVLEEGTWELENGTQLEVGTLSSDATTNSDWEEIDFSTDFENTPITLSQVQTDNGSDFVRTRQKDTSALGFSVAMEEEEALNTFHPTETLGWMAISPGKGSWNGLSYQAGNTGNRVTHNWSTLEFDNSFEREPMLLASLGTYDGSDSAGIRYRNLSGQRVEMMVEEDTSQDREMSHTTEDINFLSIGGNGTLTAYDTSLSADSLEESPYGARFNFKYEELDEIIVKPGQSIQKAIERAVPGTAIRVMPGTYREALSMTDWDVADRNTSPEKPIILLADGGPEKTIIKPPDGTQEPTIWLRLPHSQVKGFSIIGTAGFDGDNAPLKIFSKGGNILVEGNYIESTAEDVIKTGNTQKLSIVGNTLATGSTKAWKSIVPDNYIKDSGIDMVQVKDFNIQSNDFIGNYATGITMKTGSHDMTIFNNHFTGGHLDAAIKLGGRGDSHRYSDPWTSSFLGHEAKNIHVKNNVIEGSYYWGRVFQIMGGQESIIEDNFVIPSEDETPNLYYSLQANSSNWSNYYDNNENWFHSRDISIVDNIIGSNVTCCRVDPSLTPVDGKIVPENQGFVLKNNQIGTLEEVSFPFGVPLRVAD